jgi:hypothetical protein
VPKRRHPRRCHPLQRQRPKPHQRIRSCGLLPVRQTWPLLSPYGEAGLWPLPAPMQHSASTARVPGGVRSFPQWFRVQNRRPDCRIFPLARAGRASGPAGLLPFGRHRTAPADDRKRIAPNIPSRRTHPRGIRPCILPFARRPAARPCPCMGVVSEIGRNPPSPAARRRFAARPFFHSLSLWRRFRDSVTPRAGRHFAILQGPPRGVPFKACSAP